ncbi:alpha amylase C-terminal domain-containing protein [Anaerolentibacter hominis]|uniref:alpha amylase C-terminal domain-containing protein n=1 Tax=Anaerolentibacter hominis TaxID=3079009 RepID=UPI0031B8743A
MIEEFEKGRFYTAYEYFGGHEVPGGNGTEYVFRVYAPGAVRVELISESNGWDGRGFEMKPVGKNGIFELYCAGVEPGSMYKYKLFGQDGRQEDHADPFGFACEPAPGTASVFHIFQDDVWSDNAWMTARNNGANAPVNIYEMHLGSWRRGRNGEAYSYRELAEILIPYLLEYGFTHVEFMPLTEYRDEDSKGYAPTDFFAPASRYGKPEELMFLINRCHENGIGVLMDLVLDEFGVRPDGLAHFGDSLVYEKEEGSDKLKFDLSKTFVQSFLKSAAHFWLGRYHVDGLHFIHGDQIQRTGEGSSFLRELAGRLHEDFPGIMLIGEGKDGNEEQTGTESPAVYDYIWDTDWREEVLDYFSMAPWDRQERQSVLTRYGRPAEGMYSILPVSHEGAARGGHMVVNNLWGTYEEKYAQARALYSYLYTFPGKKLNFMGNETAQFREWDVAKELDWMVLLEEEHKEFAWFFRKLAGIYRDHPALYAQEGCRESFTVLSSTEENSNRIAFERKGGGEELLVVLNLEGEDCEEWKLGYPDMAVIKEIFNSDLPEFGGDGLVNPGEIRAMKKAVGGFPYHFILKSPAYSCCIFRVEREKIE